MSLHRKHIGHITGPESYRAARDRVTALEAVLDEAGIALADFGRRVPDDVSLVGYDNWEIFAADCRPPLTTVDV